MDFVEGIDVFNDLPLPTKGLGGIQEVRIWKKPKISLLGLRPYIHPRCPLVLSISVCIFRLVSHLNTYAYLICHGFASGPYSKGMDRGEGSGVGRWDSRIRRMAYYIIDWIFVREFNKICKFSSFFSELRTQSEGERRASVND